MIGPSPGRANRRLFTGKTTGYRIDAAILTAERPNLEQALSHVRAGDTLVVWRLDRLGRSLKDFIARAEELRSGGIGLKSLKEAIDTDSPTWQLVFHVFGALAEFERALIRERTQAGLPFSRSSTTPRAHRPTESTRRPGRGKTERRQSFAHEKETPDTIRSPISH